MPVIYTIGFTRIALAEFIGLLRGAAVDAVIDTRLRNTSQLAGWAKRDDLAFLLRTGFGIAYEHAPLFAPTDDLLDTYRAGGDWETYAAAYRTLLAQRQAENLGRDLLERCHRRLLAEYLAELLDGIVVTHLLGAQASASLGGKRRRSPAT
jgi:uncharacterized protein (DUF488 family)